MPEFLFHKKNETINVEERLNKFIMKGKNTFAGFKINKLLSDIIILSNGGIFKDVSFTFVNLENNSILTEGSIVDLRFLLSFKINSDLTAVDGCFDSVYLFDDGIQLNGVNQRSKPPFYLPFILDEFSNQFCIDMNTGTINYWDYELSGGEFEYEIPIVATSFPSFLKLIIDQNGGYIKNLSEIYDELKEMRESKEHTNFH